MDLESAGNKIFVTWQMQALFMIGKGKPPLVPDSLSRDARDFILKCLQVNPNDRPTATQLLDHPFVTRPQNSFGPASPHNSIYKSLWTIFDVCMYVLVSKYHWSPPLTAVLMYIKKYMSHGFWIMEISEKVVEDVCRIFTEACCYTL